MLINRDNFLIKEVPVYHPLSSKYLEYWMEEKRRCIEGYWSSGVWMPGNLYFYVNHGTILLNKDKTSKAKVKGKPALRDLEWEFFYNWVEARGFSGFSDDEEVTCCRIAKPDYFANTSEYNKELYTKVYKNIFKRDGTLKKYEDARTYLRKIHSSCKGYPLMDNDALDMMMMGCHPINTKVRMFDGTVKNIQNVEKGEKLLGVDNIPRIVKNVIRGIEPKQMYKIYQSHGDDYEVTYDHELEILDKGVRKKIKAQELFEIQNRMTRGSFVERYKGFKRKGGFEYAEKSLLINPYYLGVWLGDGNSKSAIITTSDIEIVYEISRYADFLGGRMSMYSNNYSANAKSSNYKVNIIDCNIQCRFEYYNLFNNKHIPQDYMLNSYENRLELLAGLLDTDGCLDGTYFRFYQKDEKMAAQVKELADGLGFRTSMRIRHRENTVECAVTIAGDITLIPTRIFRKQPKRDCEVNYNISTLIIEPTSAQHYFGVEVSEDNSYCLEDFTITGNSRGFG